MPSLQVRGALSQHPAAAAFAREVQRVHHRYATEVIGAFGLCPHLRDADSGFGDFFVMLDLEPDLDAAIAAAKLATSTVAHFVYPCLDGPSAPFERFGSALGAALRKHIAPAPVFAVFHPGLAGETGSPHRLVGVLRRAPDAFVQMVPEGLHEGGTVFAGSGHPLKEDRATVNFARLANGGSARVVALLEEVRRDRDASYAPYLAALRAG